MNFAILASVLVFCAWLAYEIRKHNKKIKKNTDSFWQKEALADSTRKQSLEDLNYIVLPPEILHIFGDKIDQIPNQMQESAKFLAYTTEMKILNLSYITNTDLKLRYGAANLETLTEYDTNFTNLLRHLNHIAEYFVSEGDLTRASRVLEYAVSIQSDLMSTYRMLANIYADADNRTGLDYLVNTASLLPGLTRGPILKMLDELRPEDTDAQESILDILD